jgi:hypothetical protein
MKQMNILLLSHLCLVHALTIFQFWNEPGCIGAASVYYEILLDAKGLIPKNSPSEIDYYIESTADLSFSLNEQSLPEDCKNYVGNTALVKHRSALLYVSTFSSPKAPAGSVYCSISMSPAGTFKYHQMWILKGHCAEGFTCDENGVLTIDPSQSCDTNDRQYQYQLNSVNATLLSKPYQVSAALKITSQSSIVIAWNSYLPLSKYRPNLNSLLEILAFTLWILAIALFSAAFLYLSYQWHKRRLHFVKSVEMLLWLVASIVFFHFATSTSLAGFGYAVFPRAFASYYSLIYTTRTFFESAFKGYFVEANHGCMPRTIAKMFAYVFILGLVLTFEGFMLSLISTRAAYYTETYSTYYAVYSVWAIAQFAIILLAPLPLIYRVVTDKRSVGNLWERIRRDILVKFNFVVPYLLMLGCAVAWIVIRMIPVLSYKDQRVQTSFVIIRQFFFHMSFLMNCVVLHSLRQAVEILDDRQSAPQKIPVRNFTAPATTFSSFAD